MECVYNAKNCEFSFFYHNSLTFGRNYVEICIVCIVDIENIFSFIKPLAHNFFIHVANSCNELII